MMRTTPLTIEEKGSVEITTQEGYLVMGNEEAVCFFIDVSPRAFVDCVSSTDDDCPCIYITQGDPEKNPWTAVSFSEFKGWRVHACGAGKSIAVSLVNRELEKQAMLHG